ncbi:helix-turn-helix transcriptional regulator [Streptomyces sp. NPDC054849]
MSRDQSPTAPVAAIAQRVKELRGRRGWSAAQLGEAVSKHGVRWDRFTVANLENGKRQSVSVQELLSLALALDVAPVNLLVPLDDRPYQVTPTRAEPAGAVRAWIRGAEPLPGMDERTFLAEASVQDMRRRADELSARLDLGPHPADEPLENKIAREAARMELQNKYLAEEAGRPGIWGEDGFHPLSDQ